MGVKGLTSYVERIDELWTRSQLKKTRVVIDGSCLFWHLNDCTKLDCQRGGQYKQFHESIVSFFESLRASDVEPLVVLDGAQDPSNRKLDTLIQRAKDKIADALAVAEGDRKKRVLPLLAKRTFIQAMEDLGIDFVASDCEADEEIASLGNSLDCPVISNDSDFFIYDLEGGYIPLKYLDYHSEPPTAELFEREKLAKHFKISPDLLPLLASLLGNDFISSDTLEAFHSTLHQQSQTTSRIDRVADFLSRFSSLQDGLRGVTSVVPERGRENLRKALELSAAAYTELPRELSNYIERGEIQSRLLSNSQGTLEPWVLMKFRQGLFPASCMDALTVGKSFLNAQVEKFSAVSANQCSFELRRLIYGILTQCEVEQVHGRAEALEKAAVREWDRKKKGLKDCVVEPQYHAPGYGKLPGLGAIPDLDDAEKRQLCLLLLDSNTSLVLELSAKRQLFAASLRHWILHANPPVEKVHLQALIICSLRLTAKHRPMEGFDEAKYKGPSCPPFNLGAQHSFAQWQSVMKIALYLNLVLQKPLITPRIRHLYDGLLVQDLVSKLEGGQGEHALQKDTYTLTGDGLILYRAVADGPVERLLS